MTPMTGTIKAHRRADFSTMIRHEGQEFVFVLSGQLTIHTDEHDPAYIGPGESAYLEVIWGMSTPLPATKMRATLLCACRAYDRVGASKRLGNIFSQEALSK